MYYYIKTFGCQMNYSDSERIATVLEKYGYQATSEIQKAALVVFNTCGVRQMAEDRVYGQIHNLKTKNNSLRPRIILTGCLAERTDVQRRMRDKVDLFTNIKDFPEKVAIILHEVSGTEKKRMSATLHKIHSAQSSGERINYLSLKPKYQSKFSAYVPIMTGCNNFCSYCVVPYARGREISRPAAEILQEVRGLVEKGYKLITLVGQNVNSYCDKENNFPKLLKKTNAIPGNFWLSFMTSHPKDMSDELIEAITKSKKVCEFVHLPIQAGDDGVLKRMNRKYTRSHYLTLIAKIKKSFRKYKPEKLYAIASDIIVGFPGETRKQFLQSGEVMKKVKYDMIYFGQYSPRPGTVAAESMRDNTSKKEKERREKYLNEILKSTALANNQKYLKKNIDIFVEKEKDGCYFGKTRTMKNIKLPAIQTRLVGKFAKALVTKVGAWNLEGELVK